MSYGMLNICDYEFAHLKNSTRVVKGIYSQKGRQYRLATSTGCATEGLSLRACRLETLERVSLSHGSVGDSGCHDTLGRSLEDKT